MESFDGDRRRVPRPPVSGDVRGPRPAAPLDQRLERWMSTGRQLVDGVSGSSRPGSRPGARRSDGPPQGRQGLDGLGRWVEERLDRLLDDGDDWREPWQEESRPARPEPLRSPLWSDASAGGRSDGGAWTQPAPQRRPPLAGADTRAEAPAPPSAMARPSRTATGEAATPQAQPQRRRLDALSRRSAGPERPQAPQPSAADDQDWPSDALFTINRWQRSEPARRGAAPRDSEAAGPTGRSPGRSPGEERERQGRSEPAADSRPLPRSSRRR